METTKRPPSVYNRWDWAPYSDTKQAGAPGTAATFTKGLWKSVYLVGVRAAAITHIVPHTFYQGAYPVGPLTEGPTGRWRLCHSAGGHSALVRTRHRLAAEVQQS